LAASAETGSSNPPCPDPDTLLSFVTRSLPAEKAASVERHVGGCEACRIVVSALAKDAYSAGTAASVAEPLGTAVLGRGASIDRYLVLSLLGRGGMGEVYMAYDPELDRRVAIKLLSTGGGSRSAKERLVREARALGKLSHPNVVQVYDVGEHGSDVFLAMELIDGADLGKWIRGSPRPSWSEILSAYLDAARGLSVAHERGLVHRDVKPSNIMRGRDGRVRVVDFGLAAARVDEGPLVASAAPVREEETGASQPLSETLPAPRSPRGSLAPHLTAAGTLVGTPAYMAPEQFDGSRVGPASDQYSLCAALYEALYGVQTFEAPGDLPLSARLSRLADQKKLGPPSTPPTGTDVPFWIHAALRRGLAPRPEERFPSLDALVETLGEEPGAKHQSRRRMGVAMVATALLATVGVGWGMHRTAVVDPCPRADDPLPGVWGPARRGAIATAFARSSKPFARDALRGTSDALDAYVARWADMRHEACVATRVTAEQSAELLDLRMACLGRRRDELGALVDALASADDGVIEHATQAALSLPDVDVCADVTALRAPTPPPRDLAVRARIDATRAQLARAGALEGAGKYTELLALTESTSSDAKAIGYMPLEAEGLLALASARWLANDARGSRDALFEAVVAAESSRDDLSTARAWIETTRVRGYLTSFKEAHESDRLAAAAVDRLGGDRALTSRRQYVLGQVLHGEGRYDDALASYKSSLDLMTQPGGQEPLEAAEVLQASGLCSKQLDRYDDAIATYRRALAIYERALGPDHPRVAAALGELSSVYSYKGDAAAALELSQRALGIKERALGADHPDVASALLDVANALDGLGRFDEAIGAYSRSLAMREKALGPDAPPVSDVAFAIAASYSEQLRPAEALPYAQRALATREKAYGPLHPEVGAALTLLGSIRCAAGRCAQALPLEQRALAIAEQAFGPDHVQVAEALTALGDARIGAHDPAGAVPLLERSYLLLGKRDEMPAERSECAFALARALWESGGNRSRAAGLAQEARVGDAASGPQMAKTLERVDRWLAEHRPR
jgi:tetratricopeptide (TPR) repeat protein